MMPDPLSALRLPVVPVEPRPEFTAALLRRIQPAGTQPAGTQPHDIEDRGGQPAGLAATVRYFVTDLEAAIAFYTAHLGFETELRRPGVFAMLYRGDLRLLLSVPGQPGAGEGLPAGTLPGPGGWNRMALGLADLAATAEALRLAGVRFRTGVTAGVAVLQLLVEDPSGNLVELFQPQAGYHERSPREETG